VRAVKNRSISLGSRFGSSGASGSTPGNHTPQRTQNPEPLVCFVERALRHPPGQVVDLDLVTELQELETSSADVYLASPETPTSRDRLHLSELAGPCCSPYSE